MVHFNRRSKELCDKKKKHNERLLTINKCLNNAKEVLTITKIDNSSIENAANKLLYTCNYTGKVWVIIY